MTFIFITLLLFPSLSSQPRKLSGQAALEERGKKRARTETIIFE
jgi:hypothetical protein